MGEIKFFTSLVLILLFTIAVVGYAINFAQDNDSAVSIEDDEMMSGISDTLELGLDDVSTAINQSSEGFFISEEEVSGDADIVTKTGGQFKLGLFPMIKTIGEIFNVIKIKIFGGNPLLAIFLTALSFVLTYVGIRYIWKTWKGGNPD